MLQREGEGVRQGVAAKVHGHDPTVPVLHEVGKIQIRYAQAQAFTGGELRLEVNALAPPRDA